jgi:hypothetical protein
MKDFYSGLKFVFIFIAVFFLVICFLRVFLGPGPVKDGVESDVSYYENGWNIDSYVWYHGNVIAMESIYKVKNIDSTKHAITIWGQNKIEEYKKLKKDN